MMRNRIRLVYVLSALLMLSLLPFTTRAQCSPSTNKPTTVQFVNHTADTIQYFWVNFDCNEQQYGSIAPGDSIEQPTYDGHEWIVRDLAGNELSRVEATENYMRVIVDAGVIPTLESPLDFDFRPEGEFKIIEGYEGCEVGSVPEGSGIDPFYSKYCEYEGIPIISSEKVPDLALQVAWNIVANMVQGQSRLIEGMHSVDLRIGIIAQSEGVTDLPEYNFLKNDTETNWDERARGLGATLDTPLVSGAEENLLCYPDDPYLGENIFLHEFAHTLKDMGVARVDPTFNQGLQLAFEAAQAGGLWADTYALTNHEEYWAEGVQDFFNTNLESIPANGIHNEVNTRAELKTYDPTLYAMIDTVFNGFKWTPTCPS
jgi:hypothetical protein